MGILARVGSLGHFSDAELDSFIGELDTHSDPDASLMDASQPRRSRVLSVRDLHVVEGRCYGLDEDIHQVRDQRFDA